MKMRIDNVPCPQCKRVGTLVNEDDSTTEAETEDYVLCHHCHYGFTATLDSDDDCNSLMLFPEGLDEEYVDLEIGDCKAPKGHSANGMAFDHRDETYGDIVDEISKLGWEIGPGPSHEASVLCPACVAARDNTEQKKKELIR